MSTLLMTQNFIVTIDHILVVILAGGQARRMGYQNKPLMNLGNKRMIDVVLERVQTQTSNIIINANANIDDYSNYGFPVISDYIDGYAGPLAGVLTGMKWAKEHQPNMSHIITIAGDTPFFPTSFISKCLAQKNDTTCDIVMANSNERIHPVFGLWPVALHDNLEAFMQLGNFKVLAFTDTYTTSTIEFEPQQIDDKVIDPFFNINTPEDLQLCQKILRQG